MKNLGKILVLVAVSCRLAEAQVTTYADVAVESRANSTTYTGDGLSIVGVWSADTAFQPETRGNAGGNTTHWNSEGYTGRTEWPWLAGGRTTLIGRTLQGSAAGAGKAVFVRVTQHVYNGTTIIADGNWFDRYTCTIVVSIVDWPWHPGDFNRSGNRSIIDLWTFLEQYAAGRPQADFDGDDAITMQDLFDFITAYLAP